MSAPKSKNAKISYYESHAPGWVSNAAALGVDPAMASDLQTKTSAARASYNTQETAKSALKTAIDNCDIAVEAMSVVGAQITSQIRTTAKIEGDSIYTLAGLPVPPTPSPVAPPGKPFDFGVALLPNGTIQLSWRCENPANAAAPLYHIYRRENPDVPWNFIAGVGDKKHIDTTVPAGVPRVYYQVQAARASSVGIAAEFIVNFGTSPSGMMTATVSSTPKLAA